MFQRQVESNERIVVGVNGYISEKDPSIPLLRVDERAQATQVERLRTVKASRDAARVKACLDAVLAASASGANLMPPIIEAAKAYCTQQEICDVLRGHFGTYTDPAEF